MNTPPTYYIPILSSPKKASFGELALLYDSARACSVYATCDSKVWVVSRAAFRKYLSANRDFSVNQNLLLINEVETFQCLLSDEKQKMAEWLIELHYPKVGYFYGSFFRKHFVGIISSESKNYII